MNLNATNTVEENHAAASVSAVGANRLNPFSYIPESNKPVFLKSLVGERNVKTKDDPHGWRDTETATYDKPTFFCFAGTGTNNPKEANGTSKIAETLLGRRNVHTKDIQILTAYYKPIHGEFQFIREEEEYNEPKEINPPFIKNPKYVKEFYYGFFHQLISDGNDERLSLDEVSRRINNITIFGFSHGCYIAAKVEELMAEHMKLLDYADDEIYTVMRKLVIINCAPPYGSIDPALPSTSCSGTMTTRSSGRI